MKSVLVILVFLAGFSGATAVSSFREAADLVYDRILDNDITGKAVSVLDKPVSQGMVIDSWHDEVTAPFDGYLVLVDDMVYANWAHPCRWVFVSSGGNMETVKMMTPPDDLEHMEVVHTCIPDHVDDSGNGQYENFLEWFKPNVQSTSERAAHMYALIISGGYNKSNNHIRYYGDVQFIYNVLAHDYLLPDDHIVVCFADGTNSAPDQSGGLNSNPDLDNDGDNDIIYDATSAGVEKGFSAIDSMIGADDHLFIFTTDHGDEGKPGNQAPEVILNLWNKQSYDDDKYKTKLSDMTYASCHAAMEQCFSGGFLLEHIGGTSSSPSTFASAANGTESSWAGKTYPEYNEFIYYWTGAMHGSVPPAGDLSGGDLPGNPDLNGDNCVSFFEAFDRAKAWDTYAQSGKEHPQWDDDPDSCGEQYYLGGKISTAIEDDSHQPVTGDLNLSGNPLGLMATVNFTMGATGNVDITVYDMYGRVVETLLHEELSPGRHSIKWNAGGLASGVYIIRFETADLVETLRAVKF